MNWIERNDFLGKIYYVKQLRKTAAIFVVSILVKYLWSYWISIFTQQKKSVPTELELVDNFFDGYHPRMKIIVLGVI